MDSTNMDLLTARLIQIDGVLELMAPDCDNPAVWAIRELVEQAQEAAHKLWAQKIEATA